MKAVRVIMAGIVVTIFQAFVGAVTCGGIFNWVYSLEPVNVWKPMEGCPGMGFIIAGLLLNVILAFVYAMINKGIPGKNKCVKGCVFGFIVFAVGTLPGMLATYTFMTVATTVVIYWTLVDLIKRPIEGMIIATICGDKFSKQN